MWPFKKDSDLFKDITPRQSFFMGAGWGIALTTTILLLVFMVMLLGTNQVVPKSVTSGEAVEVDNKAANQQPSPPPRPQGDISKISPISNNDYIRGDKNAKLTLIEYSDFQCPFCARHIPTLDKILEEYKGQVRLVYRHLPLTSIHPQAQKAAEAAECAGEQGKFWEMHDKMFDNQRALSIDNLKSYAKDLGLNSSQFDNCLDSGKYASKVNKHAREAAAAGVTGTPGTFVGDQLVKGAVPYESFKSIIDSKLK